MKSLSFCFLLICFALLFISCNKEKNSGNTRSFSCNATTPKFTSDVQPVLISLCSTSSSCHGSGASNSGGMLISYSQVNAKKSNIKSSILNGSMPQGGSISQAQIDAVVCWIDSGAPNN